MYTSEADYKNLAFDQLLKQASDLLFEFRSVNRPLAARGRRVLPAQSEVSICAHPDGKISFNFASRAVQAMMLDAVPDAEAVRDELGRRIATSREQARKGRETYDKLGREVIHFLDGRRLTGPLDTDEIRDFAIESVRSPLLPAMF